MIYEILSFVRGEEKLNLELTSLKEIVNETLSILKPVAKEIGIHITLNYTLDNDRLYLDKSKIYRVIYNLYL